MQNHLVNKVSREGSAIPHALGFFSRAKSRQPESGGPGLRPLLGGPGGQGLAPVGATRTCHSGPGRRTGRLPAGRAHGAAPPAINVPGSLLLHGGFSGGGVCSAFPNETNLHVKKAECFTRIPRQVTFSIRVSRPAVQITFKFQTLIVKEMPTLTANTNTSVPDKPRAKAHEESRGSDPQRPTRRVRVHAHRAPSRACSEHVARGSLHPVPPPSGADTDGTQSSQNGTSLYRPCQRGGSTWHGTDVRAVHCPSCVSTQDDDGCPRTGAPGRGRCPEHGISGLAPGHELHGQLRGNERQRI